VLLLLLIPWYTLVLAGIALLAAMLQPHGHAFLVPGRWWCRLILATTGVRVRRRIDPAALQGPYVVVVNHQSHFDVPALATTWQGPFRMVAKRSLFHIPVMGWAMRMGGFVAVDRGSRQRAIASLSGAVRQIERGASMVLFAEGTRSSDGQLQTFKKGAFHLAQQAGVPIVPVTVSGSRAVLPRQGWVPRAGVIDVVVGAPLDPPAPGDAVDDVVQATAAALRAGYTKRHQADLAERR
jgi:1-acyl-sn-glycerol-3-phosphate acyltransferase